MASEPRKERRKVDLRHYARHADQAIDASEAYTDPPQPGGANDFLAQRLVTGCEAQHCAGSIGDPIMYITTGVGCETRVIYRETKFLQHVGYEHCGLLLAIHANSKCLDSTKKEEGIERS
jgi:hypothetical protein